MSNSGDYSRRNCEGHPNSENNYHCARRNLIKKITHVVKVQHNATPGEMSRPVVAPFPRPPVKPDAAAQPGTLQSRGPLLPTRRDRRFLLRSDVSGGSSARRVITVRIIDLDPVPAVIGAVGPVEFAPALADDEIHPLRGLIVALYRLLPFTLSQTDVVFAFHAPVSIEAHLIALMIDQNQRPLQLRDEQFAARGDESRRLGVALPHPLLVLAVR